MTNYEENEGETMNKSCCTKLRRGVTQFLRKYLWTDQYLRQSVSTQVHDNRKENTLVHAILTTYRRVVAFLIPITLFHFLWWIYMIYNSAWSLFLTRYKLTITMFFASVLAGVTSIGGGVVAFPVMTLAFSVSPIASRDFVLMIQSCGLTAATISILFMRVQLDWYNLVFCSLGGIVGLLFGFQVIDPLLSPPAKKMGFVSVWFAFGLVLAISNVKRKSKTFPFVQNFNLWKLGALLVTGFVGGIFTSVAGCGLDICSLSVMTLVFRLTERVAAPTSLILMGFNSIIGFYWRGLVLSDITDEPYAFLAVCIPVVVVGAPIGSVLGSHMHRQVLAFLLIILALISIISAFLLVQLTSVIIGASCAVIFLAVCFFAFLNYLGHRLHLDDENKEDEATKDIDVEKSESMKNTASGDDGHCNDAFTNEQTVF